MSEKKTKKNPVRDLKPSRDAKGGGRHGHHGHSHHLRSGANKERPDTPGRGYQL
jgi:hypothetical protein